MKSPRQLRSSHCVGQFKQQGLILFVALMALVILMLIAVALTRSVDTNTVIAGNLAFKQSATTAADAGLEKAMEWLRGVQLANLDTDPFTDPSHPFNVTAAANGYYSSVNNEPAFLKDKDTWGDAKSVTLATADAGGNTVRYIIERMCRDPNTVLSETNCLFSDAEKDDSSFDSNKLQALKGGKSPMNRITVRVTGPKNTVSYVQAFVY
jgi:type IV pilus assembly protein PilX